MVIAHKAASDFVSKSPKTQAHRHLLHVALQFFRPTLPSPVKTVLEVRIANIARASTTLHVTLVQSKPCLAGYIT